VAGALGDEHFSVNAMTEEKRGRTLGALPRDIGPPPGAGNRIDDDRRSHC
jgi:hypothetical protein